MMRMGCARAAQRGRATRMSAVVQTTGYCRALQEWLVVRCCGSARMLYSPSSWTPSDVRPPRLALTSSEMERLTQAAKEASPALRVVRRSGSVEARTAVRSCSVCASRQRLARAASDTEARPAYTPGGHAASSTAARSAAMLTMPFMLTSARSAASVRSLGPWRRLWHSEAPVWCSASRHRHHQCCSADSGKHDSLLFASVASSARFRSPEVLHCNQPEGLGCPLRGGFSRLRVTAATAGQEQHSRRPAAVLNTLAEQAVSQRSCTTQRLKEMPKPGRELVRRASKHTASQRHKS